MDISYGGWEGGGEGEELGNREKISLTDELSECESTEVAATSRSAGDGTAKRA